MEAKKILVLENSEDTLGSIHLTVPGGVQVLLAHQKDQAIRMGRSELPDLILSSIDISHIGWFEVYEAIRRNEATRHIPIMVISEPDIEERRILAFEKGIDDLVLKPLTSRELQARILAKFRRIEERKSKSKVLSCGSLVLDLERLEVFGDGKQISLSVLEFNILKYFVENMGRVLSRRKILEAVWRDSIVSDRTVDTHIACLRRKLQSFDPTLTTVYGAGYTLKPRESDEVPSA